MKNNIETEFKFLIDRIPKIKFDRKLEITQIYFNGFKCKTLLIDLFKLSEDEFNMIHTFRARIIKENQNVDYIITLKTKGITSRKELELNVSKDIYDLLINNNIVSIIIKNRYILKDQYNYEFDEYLNLQNKLFTCEVEVTLDEMNDNIKTYLMNNLQKKYLLSVSDITMDNRYKNSNLHKYF